MIWGHMFAVLVGASLIWMAGFRMAALWLPSGLILFHLFAWGLIKAHLAVGALGLSMRLEPLRSPDDMQIAQELVDTLLYTGWGTSVQEYVFIGGILSLLTLRTLWYGEHQQYWQ